MSDELRAAVRDRRRFPDGRMLEPKIIKRGGTEVLSYPWDEMKLGDFFFVPLRGQKAQPLKIRFRQAAARRDWELTLVQWKLGTEIGIRVALTLLDVSEIKKKAQQHHKVKGIRFSDGQWSTTRKARYLRSKGTPKLRVMTPDPKLIEQDVRDHFAPVTDASSIDATLSPNYDRDQIIRDRLAALGIKA